MKPILLVGGTDPSGAGLQTDWKVINALQVQASSVVSAVTSQNHSAVHDNGILPYKQIKAQFDSLSNENFSAIKIGMLGNEQVIKALCEFLDTTKSEITVILDPVLAASSGGKLLNEQGTKQLLSYLLPRVSIITPNIDELTLLTNLPVNTHHEVEIAASHLLERGAKAVFVKGGHFQTNSKHCTDLFINNKDKFYLTGERWKDRENVRGTGCVLASSIASAISKGYSLTDALVFAKAFISKGIRHALKDNQQYQFQFPTSDQNFQLKDLPTLTRDSKQIDHSFNFPDCGSKRLGIYPVVDSVEWLKKLVPLGVETIQLRIKDKQDKEVESDIRSAIEFCRTYNTRLFINDYWQLAIKHKAYGIHLGQEDVESADLQEIADSGCRLGLSTHSYTEVARAHAINPSYLALGPIFETTSKVMPWIPQGVEAVEKWVELLGEDYPLVAIGGINHERAKALKKTGVGSVAMITAITQTEDYVQATEALLSLWDNAPDTSLLRTNSVFS